MAASGVDTLQALPWSLLHSETNIALMPRINPKDFLRARAINDALLSLLPVCRDLTSAQNELRWMRQHAINVSRRARVDQKDVLRSYVARRIQGEPLQYILGSEYFGELEIKCRPGVLIPRCDRICNAIYKSCDPDMYLRLDQRLLHRFPIL